MLALTLSLYILVFSPTGTKPARAYQFPDTEGSGGTPEFIVQHRASPTTTTTNETDPGECSVKLMSRARVVWHGYK
ncbi:hypothetical protein V5799_034188 [Amblyomma americanum]|uniref:Secreted protein n=1 Tax=Amblyomma americanum TaxID=6943 RepID=A0AAQ4DL62_AMBAM